MKLSNRYQPREAPKGVRHFRQEQRLATKESSGDSFTLGTYNVKNLFDDQDQDPKLGMMEKPEAELAALARNIERSGADVFTLQEVENLPVLEKFLNDYLPGKFSEVVLVEGNDGRGIDVAVISKFPVSKVVSHKEDRFPLADGNGETSFNRDLLRVDLDVKGIPFSVYTSHFKSKRGGQRAENERVAEAQQTRRILAREMAPYERHNFVVTGDLNDTPDSKTLQVLTQPWEGQEALYNSLESLSDAERRTFPSKKPKDQLDHILMPQHLRDNLVESSVYRDHDSKMASDHLMVRATFRLQG